MSKPPTGYYHQLMPPELAYVRLAIAGQPMIGVEQIDPAPVLSVLDSSTDEHATYYAEGLRSGRILAIREAWNGTGRRWAPGELFLRS